MARTIELTEFVPRSFPRGELDEALMERLWRGYRTNVAVDFPSPQTEGQWRLTAQGYAGYIPLSSDFGVILHPKVKLKNLFRMLDYAYGLEKLPFISGLFECPSLQEFYEQLASRLASLVMNRSRKGLYRGYLNQEERLPFIRGRVDMQKLLRSPWSVKRDCQYEEHLADIDENKILAWTLFVIARGGVCSDRVMPGIRRAYHGIQAGVSLQECRSIDCVGRLYNRLNEDYRPMHAICRFFLENAGPRLDLGDHTMIPFIISVANLFELFVAKWLESNLPVGLGLKAQEKVPIGNDLSFRIDLVVYDSATGEHLFVLDTKYKDKDKPLEQDISQVVSYAEAMGCSEAILIYPKPLLVNLDQYVGRVRVRTLSFALDGDLDQSGITFLNGLLGENGSQS